MIRPIETPEEFLAAMREMEGIFLAERGTPEGDRLEVLMDLVEAYELRLFPLEDRHGNV